MNEAYVLGGVRTPFARYEGTLSHVRTDELLGMSMKGACEHGGVPLDQVEDSVAGATINRYCGSSLSVVLENPRAA